MFGARALESYENGVCEAEADFVWLQATWRCPGHQVHSELERASWISHRWKQVWQVEKRRFQWKSIPSLGWRKRIRFSEVLVLGFFEVLSTGGNIGRTSHFSASIMQRQSLYSPSLLKSQTQNSPNYFPKNSRWRPGQPKGKLQQRLRRCWSLRPPLVFAPWRWTTGFFDVFSGTWRSFLLKRLGKIDLG